MQSIPTSMRQGAQNGAGDGIAGMAAVDATVREMDSVAVFTRMIKKAEEAAQALF